jgi:hypothetical protein
VRARRLAAHASPTATVTSASPSASASR